MNTAWKAGLLSLIIVLACGYALQRSINRPTLRGTQYGAGAQGPRGPQKQLTFFCAAGIKPPVEEVAREYEELFGVEIQIQYQGSGTLLSSLKVTDTGDLYLAADRSYIDLARKANLIAETIPLAKQRPVIAVPTGNPKNIDTLDDLLREDVRVAVANPEAASVGRQTQKLLQKTGHWEALEQQAAVFKPTVTEVANDVKLGTVDAGIVWDSTVNQYDDLEAVHVQPFDAAVQEVLIAVLQRCKQPTEALRFARYLAAKDRGQRAFVKHGYEPVDGDEWAVTPEVLFYSGGVNRVAIEDTIREFEAREGCSISTVYNGCGILVGQMKAGARPDAYFSCDVSFMTQVADLFYESDKVTNTKMVIAVDKGNPKDIHSLKDLTRPGLAIGVTNPKQSALGHLTERMLDKLGLLEGVMNNVRSQTPTADLLINQLRAGKGSLDAVIVYEANCSKVRDKLDVIYIDSEAALAIQDLAVAKQTKYPQLVGRLVEALESAQQQKRSESLGFDWRLPKPQE